ncbi:hypothetical protein [Azospirillum argentinense]|uniref:hypothetical protein n=1 Tax=Azospirillum argentinense TaxID=2970906 RepID=UPI0013648305|nr:hypothetical protein [Azospirillum argentinense]
MAGQPHRIGIAVLKQAVLGRAEERAERIEHDEPRRRIIEGWKGHDRIVPR